MTVSISALLTSQISDFLISDEFKHKYISVHRNTWIVQGQYIYLQAEMKPSENSPSVLQNSKRNQVQHGACRHFKCVCINRSFLYMYVFV